MNRSVTERYAIAAAAFMAAAVWLGVGLVNGFLCLFVFLLAGQAVRIYQRRDDARERAVDRRRQQTRRRPAAERPSRSVPYDTDREQLDWQAVGDAAW